MAEVMRSESGTRASARDETDRDPLGLNQLSGMHHGFNGIRDGVPPFGRAAQVLRLAVVSL